MERRDFLKRFIKWTLGLLGIGTAASSVFLYPPQIKDRPITFFPALDFKKRPKRGVKVVNFIYKRKGKEIETSAYFAVSGNEIIAFSPVCTHLGCMVRWDRLDQVFRCPCHGGVYDKMGNVIEGPPPASLTRLPLKTIDGIIHVGLKV